MVLRAFVAHSRHRRSRVAKHAAALLASRFFQPDKYADRRGREYWTKFTYPFVFTDLLTSLDSLGRLAFSADHPDISRAIAWFAKEHSFASGHNYEATLTGGYCAIILDVFTDQSNAFSCSNIIAVINNPAKFSFTGNKLKIFFKKIII